MTMTKTGTLYPVPSSGRILSGQVSASTRSFSSISSGTPTAQAPQHQPPPASAHFPTPELILSGTVPAERNAKWNRGLRQRTQSAEKKSSLRPRTLQLCDGSKLTQQSMTPDREHDTTPPASRVSNMQGRPDSTGLIVAPDRWRRTTFPILLRHPENLPLHTHVARALASLVHQLCISHLLHAGCSAAGRFCQV